MSGLALAHWACFLSSTWASSFLYGGNDPLGRSEEKSPPSDAQLRATLKHRF
jgi:hypothetical protein